MYPLNLSADYSRASIAPTSTLFDPWFLGGLVSAGLLLYLSWRRRSPLVLFIIAFFVLALLPASNLFFLAPSAMAERYLFLALQPLALAFGLGIQTLMAGPLAPRLGRATSGLAVFLLILYGARSIERNRDWHSDYTLFTAVLELYPRNARAHENLANTLYRRGSIDQAISHYEKSYRNCPRQCAAPLQPRSPVQRPQAPDRSRPGLSSRPGPQPPNTSNPTTTWASSTTGRGA